MKQDIVVLTRRCLVARKSARVGRRRAAVLVAAAVASTLFAATPSARAGSLYFSGAGATMWDNGVTSDWATSSGGPYNASTWVNANNYDAFFEGTAAAVTVSSVNPVSANSITFTTDGFNFTGGTITLTGTGGNITTGIGTDTIGSVIAGTVGLTKNGTGTLTLIGANGYSGGTTVSGGILQIGDGTTGHDGSISGNITDNANLTFDIFGAGYTYGGIISSSGSVTKTGPGMVWFSGGAAQTFSGAVTISQGTLRVSNSFIGESFASAAISSGAFLDMYAGNISIDMLTGQGTVTNNFTNAVTLTVGAAGGTSEFDGVIQNSTSTGTVYLTKTGAGIFTLTGNNTYTGNTLVSGGTLSISSLANINGNNSGYVAIQSGGTLQYTGTGSETRTGAVYWNNGVATINVSSSTADLTFAITGGTRNNPFTKSGPGQLTLSKSTAINDVTGSAVTISGGTLEYNENNAGAIDRFSGAVTGAAGTQINVSGTGYIGNESLTANWSSNLASLNIGSTASFDLRGQGITVDALTGAGTLSNSFANGTDTVTIGINGASGTFSGSIVQVAPAGYTTSGSPVTALTKTGSGIETLSGTNSYTGTTTVTGGTLSISSLANINGNSSGYVAIQTGGTLQYTGSGSETRTGAFYCNSGAATFNVSSPTGDLTFAVTGGTLNGTSLTKTGAGQLTLSSASLSLPTTISGGILQVGDGITGHDGSIGVNITDNANLTFDVFAANYQYGGVISGSGSVTKTGPGMVWFTNNSTAQSFTGALSVSQGTLRVSNNYVTESLTSAAISSGATIDMYYGSLNLNTLTGQGTLTDTGNSGVLSVGGTSSSSQFDGTISGGTALTTTGTGTFTLTGNNTYTGVTAITTGGTLSISSLANINGDSSGYVAIQTGGTLQYTGAGSETRTGAFYCNSGAATVNVSSSTGDLTFAVTGGTLNGTSLTKTGAGQLTLSSASLSLPTTISGGILQVGDGTTGHDGSIGVNITDNANLTFDIFAANYQYGGVISGSGGVAKTGPGMVWFSNTGAVQTFTGAVTVTQGTLRVSNNGLGETYSSAAISSGAFLDMYAGNISIDMLTGQGTVTNNYTNGVTLTVGAAGGTSEFDGVIQNSTSTGTVYLTKTGAGVFTLTGNNTYTGNTTITGGTLSIASLASINGDSSGYVAIQSGGTLQYTGIGSETRTGVLYWNSGAATINVSSSTANLTFAITSGTRNNPLTKSGPGQLTLSKSTAINDVTGSAVTISGGTLEFNENNAGAIDRFAGTVTGAAGTQINVSGTGYIGNENLTANWNSNLASLNIGSVASFDLRGQGITVDALTGAGTLANSFASGNDTVTIGINGASGTFSGSIVQVAPTGYTTSGTPVTALTKTGSGIETLSGTNSYTGGTTINGGALLANNPASSTGTGAVTVITGGVLGGNGKINNLVANPVKIGNGVSQTTAGMIAPGTPFVVPTATLTGTPFYGIGATDGQVGTLTVAGNLTLQGVGSGNSTVGGTYYWKVDPATPAQDMLSVGGTLNIDDTAAAGATFNIAIEDFGAFVPSKPVMTFTIATASSGIDINGSSVPAGFVTSDFTVSDNLYHDWTVEVVGPQGGSQSLEVIGTVPEPGSLGLLSIAALGLLRRRRTSPRQCPWSN